MTRIMEWALAAATGAGVALATQAMLGFAQHDGGAKPPATTQPAKGDPSQLGSQLIAGLKATEGCLGVDTGQMMSGKNAIFAWFENKKAAMRWYRSDTHQHTMQLFFPNGTPNERPPMDGVPDDVPLMVIASLTPADAATREKTKLPVSQIAVEIYTPMTGGLFVGSRFAPAALVVPGMHDFTPKP